PHPRPRVAGRAHDPRRRAVPPIRRPPALTRARVGTPQHHPVAPANPTGHRELNCDGVGSRPQRGSVADPDVPNFEFRQPRSMRCPNFLRSRTMLAATIAAFGVLAAACGSDEPDIASPVPGVEADDDHGEFAVGEPAESEEADRVIEIDATDDFAFE